jgi:hypothetical protein
MSFTRQSPEERQAAREAQRQANIAALVGSSLRPLAKGSYGGTTRKLPEPAKPARATPTKATPAEREHMGRVKRLGCVLCAALDLRQTSITDVHHIREGQGGAQRASHWLTVALCHESCHTGPHGIHGDRALLRQAKCTELDLLAWTLEALECTQA